MKKSYQNINYNCNDPEASLDELDLRELAFLMWKNKWIIIGTIFVFTTCSFLYAIYQPNTYKSEALLAPASEEKNGGLAALAGQFGGLASLAGINLDGSKSDKSALAVEVMKSRQFISTFIQKHDLLPNLIAADKWNSRDNRIIYDNELYDENQGNWVREVKYPFKPKPSMQEAFKKFKKIMSVSVDKESGLVKVSVEHVSPIIAQQWVEWLVEDINEVMKQRDVTDAKKSVEFLNATISQTNVADIRTILYKLIEEQTKIIMFAEVRNEYVFNTIDPAVIPEEKFKPRRALICAVGFVMGAILAGMFILLRHFMKKD